MSPVSSQILSCWSSWITSGLGRCKSNDYYLICKFTGSQLYAKKPVNSRFCSILTQAILLSS